MFYVTVTGSLFYLTTDITLSSGRFESWQAVHGSPLFQNPLSRCPCILAQYNVVNVAENIFVLLSDTRRLQQNIYLLQIEVLLNKITSLYFPICCLVMRLKCL